jgi:hypothetical protein
MVRYRQVQKLKIDNLTWDMERHNLPLSTAENFVAAGKAANEKAAIRRLASLSDQLVPVPYGLNSEWKKLDRLPVPLVHLRESFEPACKQSQGLLVCGPQYFAVWGSLFYGLSVEVRGHR